MNQNLVKETLEEMFQKALLLLENFNREEYRTSFEDYIGKYRVLLKEQIVCANGQYSKEQIMDMIGGVLPHRARTLLSQNKTKAERNQMLLKYDMAMSVYVLPALYTKEEPFLEQLSKKIVQVWKTVLGDNLTLSRYESILAGFRERLCYVTTAVCEGLGKPDNCYELQLLRKYRDEYLLEQCKEEKLVKSYYNMAPTIVKRINKKENSKEIYQDIWKTYLEQCVAFIEQNKLEECRLLYTKMVKNLCEKYLYAKEKEENHGQETEN